MIEEVLTQNNLISYFESGEVEHEIPQFEVGFQDKVGVVLV